jgi:hypothetical protein
MAAMFITCSLAMLAAQSILLFSSVRSRIDQRWVAVAFAGSALALAFTSWVPDAGSLGLMIAVVATGAGMVGPVLSYELLERQSAAPGKLLGQQAAAGNLGQALGSMGAGSLFTLAPMMPFWTAALVLLVGAVLSLAWWGAGAHGRDRRPKSHRYRDRCQVTADRPRASISPCLPSWGPGFSSFPFSRRRMRSLHGHRCSVPYGRNLPSLENRSCSRS